MDRTMQGFTKCRKERKKNKNSRRRGKQGIENGNRTKMLNQIFDGKSDDVHTTMSLGYTANI